LQQDNGNEVSFFSSLSPYSGFPCSRLWHGDKEGKSKGQGKGMQRLARAYIARTERRIGESKETIKPSAFNAKTMGTTMITFPFLLLTACACMPH
jgi:hypothetical protein